MSVRDRVTGAPTGRCFAMADTHAREFGAYCQAQEISTNLTPERDTINLILPDRYPTIQSDPLRRERDQTSRYPRQV
jgi:hypothetical protein